MNNRNFSVEYTEDDRPPEEAGDIGPEHIKFVNSDEYGVPLIIIANTIIIIDPVITGLNK